MRDQAGDRGDKGWEFLTRAQRADGTPHILLALPSGSFPGVDEADVFEFLDRHATG